MHCAACFFYGASLSQAAALGLENENITETCPDQARVHVSVGSRYGWAFGWTVALTLSSAYPFTDAYLSVPSAVINEVACGADGASVEGTSHPLVTVYLFLGIFVQAYVICVAVNITAETRAMGSRRRAQRARLKVLMHEKNVPLMTVPDQMQLGEWAGLCKIDAEGNARKVVKCGAAAIRDWGEETEGLNVVQANLKSAE